MIIKDYFYNVQCDCCKKTLGNEELWNVDPIKDVILGSDHSWRELGGKDYCPNCWSWDDDDNIITNDGKVWDADTEELLKEE